MQSVAEHWPVPDKNLTLSPCERTSRFQIPVTGEENFMLGIEGKVVAITGASSGIGEATALLLAERGAKVVLGARGSDRLALSHVKERV